MCTLHVELRADTLPVSGTPAAAAAAAETAVRVSYAESRHFATIRHLVDDCGSTGDRVVIELPQHLLQPAVQAAVSFVRDGRLSACSFAELCAVDTAADWLDCGPLLRVTELALAKHINAAAAAPDAAVALCALIGITDSLPPDKLEQIRKEHVYCTNAYDTAGALSSAGTAAD